MLFLSLYFELFQNQCFERIDIDTSGSLQTLFDAATNDRLTKYQSAFGRFTTLDQSISFLQNYLKTEIDAQSGMINTRFGESDSNVNFHFTSSTDDINHQFSTSTNNINAQFTASTNNVNNQCSFSTNNINNRFSLSANNINDKYNSLSTQITTRMNSSLHYMHKNFTTHTDNVNNQFRISTDNINTKYNLLKNQMDDQSDMIRTRFNTLAYGLRKNISLTMKTVKEGNIDIINEIEASTDQLRFRIEHDINDVNETVNYIKSKVYDKLEIIKEIRDAMDNLNNDNVASSGKAGINVMIQEETKKYDSNGFIVSKMRASDSYIFITAIIALNMIFIGLMMIVFMKCYNGCYSATYDEKI